MLGLSGKSGQACQPKLQGLCGDQVDPLGPWNDFRMTGISYISISLVPHQMTGFVLPVSFWCCPSITENYSANTNIFNSLFQEHVWSRKFPCHKILNRRFSGFLADTKRTHDLNLKQKNLPCNSHPFGQEVSPLFSHNFQLHHGSPEKKDLQKTRLLQWAHCPPPPRETGCKNHDSLSKTVPGKAILCTHNLGHVLMWCVCFPAADSQQMKPAYHPAGFLFTKYKQIQKITQYISIYIYICMYMYIHIRPLLASDSVWGTFAIWKLTQCISAPESSTWRAGAQSCMDGVPGKPPSREFPRFRKWPWIQNHVSYISFTSSIFYYVTMTWHDNTQERYAGIHLSHTTTSS